MDHKGSASLVGAALHLLNYMKINSIPKILCIIFTAVFLTGFRGPSSTTTIPKEPHQGIWSIPTGVGVNWKPKAQATNNAWMGFVATIGIKWEKQFCKRYTFSSGLLWGLFLPDMFVADRPTEFRIFNIITIPYNLALYLPMTSVQVGYFVNSRLHFSGGLIYFYAAEFNVNYLVSSKIALNARCCLFLDKVFLDHGIHLGFATIGIDWRL